VETPAPSRRFWASPDEEWFWDIVAPLEQVVLATDRPRDAAAYLQERAGD
jgi:hypothetical protein